LRSNSLGCCGDLLKALWFFDNPVVNKGFFHKKGKVIHREKEVFTGLTCRNGLYPQIITSL